MNLVTHVQMAQSCWLPNSCSELQWGQPDFILQAPQIPLTKAAFTNLYGWGIAPLSRLETKVPGPDPPVCPHALIAFKPITT